MTYFSSTLLFAVIFIAGSELIHRYKNRTILYKAISAGEKIKQAIKNLS